MSENNVAAEALGLLSEAVGIARDCLKRADWLLSALCRALCDCGNTSEPHRGDCAFLAELRNDEPGRKPYPGWEEVV